MRVLIGGQGGAVFFQQGVRRIHFIKCDLQFKVSLGQGDVVVHLQAFVEVLHFAEIEHELVHALLVLFDEGVEFGHVGFFGV